MSVTLAVHTNEDVVVYRIIGRQLDFDCRRRTLILSDTFAFLSCAKLLSDSVNLQSPVLRYETVRRVRYLSFMPEYG
jgi:hypothetical protein